MPAIAWMVVIFIASTSLGSAAHTSRFIGPLLQWLLSDVSAGTIAAVQFFVRKSAHVTEYAILGALLFRAFTSTSGRPKWQYGAVALGVAAGYAALDEFHQSFLRSRTGSPRDVLIDIAGAALGLALWWLFARRANRRTAAVPA